MAKPSKVLQPQYVSWFACTGPSCIDNCCHLWQIVVDKQTFQKYRRCPDPALRAELAKHVIRNRSNPSEQCYASIRLNDNNECPLLNAEGWCSLQRNFGEDYLSATCHLFPRYIHKVSGDIEMALTMACPEVAQSALLNPNPMEFEYVEKLPTRFDIGEPEFNPEDYRYASKPERYFWPLRVFVISLLQNRNYQIWQRLIILGFFSQALQELNSNPDGIPELIERYTRLIEQGTFHDELEAIPTRYDVQIDILKQLVQYRLTGTDISPTFANFFNEIKDQLGLEDEDISTTIEKYQSAFEAYYRPFMNEHEYILENYLVNYVFKNLFPFGKRKLFDDYVMLVLNISIIKLLLIGLAGCRRENFTFSHIIELFYSYSRTVEHADTFLDEIYKLFKNRNLLTMPYMAVLIRN